MRKFQSNIYDVVMFLGMRGYAIAWRRHMDKGMGSSPRFRDY